MQIMGSTNILSPRLEAIISLIRNGAVISDIGCDHAYISVEAIKRNIAKFAVASDIRPGPLQRAEENISEFCRLAEIKKEDRFSIVLGDGLEKAESYCPDDIIIAGMGGELIAKIIDDSPYIKNKGVNLILQPMTSSYELRKYLSQSGFSIIREMREREDEKRYEIILATYTGMPYEMTEGELTVGRKNDFALCDAEKYTEFAQHKIAKLEKIIYQKRTNGADFLEELQLVQKISELIF